MYINDCKKKQDAVIRNQALFGGPTRNTFRYLLLSWIQDNILQPLTSSNKFVFNVK